MLKSMTGYGLGSVSKDNYEITAEVKTLNSKFADVSVRIPGQWSSLELILRKQVVDTLVRGKSFHRFDLFHFIAQLVQKIIL